MDSDAHVNIDQSAMRCISMNLPQEALQTNGRFFFKFKFIFELLMPQNLKCFEQISRCEY